MRVLGIDTSTKYAGVAIVEDGVVLAQSVLQFMASHSEKLLPEIARILETMKMPLETINYYAVTVGPGSFTGLRVSLSTIKGLSFATERKVIPLSTLEVIARGLAFVDYPICPILDARKKEVYAALFKWKKDELIRLKEDSVLNFEDLKEWLSEKTIFVGDGLNIYREKLAQIFGDKALFAKNTHNITSPAIVAMMGEEKAKEGKFISARDLQPIYLRKSEAEIKFG